MEWKKAATVEGGISIPERWIYLRYYEVFNLLFRIENALRVFVFIVLKDHLREGWAEAHVIADDDQGTIASLAKKRLSQSQSFGYLGHPIACPIMHLNSGELTRLIVSEAYWKLFKPHFLGGKEIIKSKLDEIGSIRNSFAHFRPVRTDDVDVLKQNSKHVLLGIEEFLNQALIQRDVVPTNTQDDWYRALKTLGTDQCVFTFRQSVDEQWVRIGIKYRCPVIEGSFEPEYYAHYTPLTIRSSAILTKYPEIANDVCYLSERVASKMRKDGNAEFSKVLSFVLSRSMLKSYDQGLKPALEELLLTITDETELIQQDNLARGQLVHSTSVSAHQEDAQKYWRWNNKGLETPVAPSDPPEYWGNFSGSHDFISATDRYPWMPEDVSSDEIPF